MTTPAPTSTAPPGTPPAVRLLGRSHHITLPGHIERMELAAERDTQMRRRRGLGFYRACAALVGLCTRIGRLAGVDYAACGCDPLVYGGAVFNWYKAQGGDEAELLAAATAVYDAILPSLVPTVEEVKEREDFSEAPAGGST